MVSVTEAGESDVEAIAEFFWEGWRSVGPNAPGWAGASEAVIAQIADHDAIRERIGGPRRMFVARADGRIVGFSATKITDDDTTELAGIIVLEDMHGSGIGTVLVRSAAESAASHGAQRLSVKTETTNESAIEFYRRNGFTDPRLVVEEIEGKSLELTEMTLPL